jgi:cysteine desulfurase
MMRVYMDNNSTTQVDSRVVDVMVPCFRANYGNPSSAHSAGAEAVASVERARLQIADLLNAEQEQIIFCSSATEAINTVLQGVGTGDIVTSCVEHAATLESAAKLAKHGASVNEIRVDSTGMLDWALLEKAVAQRPKLLSLMWVNNETGIVFPIQEVARLCEEFGVLLHVDAVQAAGKIDIDFAALPITFLSISSHKMFGPKGVGALLVRDTAHLRPLVFGGGQERGLRGGTENVPGIVGFGEAARLAKAERIARVSHVVGLRNYFERELLKIRNARVNGGESPRVANTSNVEFAGVDSGDLVAVLDGMGIAVSNGSACHSKSLAPSHVLLAMTGSRDTASESLRFSMSHLNTFEEINYVLASLKSAIATLDATTA